MKKHLAICYAFFTVCAIFTSCGMNDNGSDVENDKSDDYVYYTTEGRRDDDIKKPDEYVSGVIEGIGEAGKDAADGVGEAAKDIIDAADIEKDTTAARTTVKTTTVTTSAKDDTAAE
ncbi:MAG: hypothetical protein MJ081_00885 [Ruminococcus sp.]|nr:hypothetical protein [Ruminococcus sp.]